MTALIQPDGDRWQICVQSFAGINPVGTRLYKMKDSQRQELRLEWPSLETRNLSKEDAEIRLKGWRLFLKVQSELKTKRK